LPSEHGYFACLPELLWRSLASLTRAQRSMIALPRGFDDMVSVSAADEPMALAAPIPESSVNARHKGLLHRLVRHEGVQLCPTLTRRLTAT
jgi:hypothetical protein